MVGRVRHQFELLGHEATVFLAVLLDVCGNDGASLRRGNFRGFEVDRSAAAPQIPS